MPHAGGGGGHSGGGFHSSGGHSSTPRFDHSGKPHSSYYIRPGFYYNHVFVPYERKNRIRNALFAPIITIVFALFFSIVITFAVISDTKYSEDNLESYSIDRYYDVYDEDKPDFEYNLLISIVAYPDGKTYDYITIVGDYVDKTTDLWFGNQFSLFGGLVYANVEDVSNNLYSDLAYCLKKVNDGITDNLGNGVSNCKIINETTYVGSNGKSELENEFNTFYEKTGYNISLLVSDSEEVYKLDIVPIVFICIAFIASIGFAIFLLKRNMKAVKAINESEAQGNERDYFEGEDDYDTFMKENGQDDNDQYDWKRDY